MGPVVSKGQYDKILAYIKEARDQGVQVFYGTEAQQQELAEKFPGGCFITPTVFIDVPTTSRVWKEEIFGPVLCIRVSSIYYNFFYQLQHYRTRTGIH